MYFDHRFTQTDVKPPLLLPEPNVKPPFLLRTERKISSFVAFAVKLNKYYFL